MLSRSSTQPPAPAPAPPPVPAHEKQGGFKQLTALLSPMPIPVEKQRDLPKTPDSVPIHSTPSPTPEQARVRETAAAEAQVPNGEVEVPSEKPAADTARTDGLAQGNINGAGVAVTVVGPEHVLPAPPVDLDVMVRSSSPTIIPEPASEGTSVAT